MATPIYGLEGLGRVADIPGAIAGGEQFKLHQDAVEQQRRAENTQWLAGAAKYALDNWGQRGILESIRQEGERRGIPLQFDPSTVSKQSVIKVYQQAKTALGGTRFEDVEGPLPAGQRDTLTGQVTPGRGSVPQPRVTGPLQQYDRYVQEWHAGMYGNEPLMGSKDFAREIAAQASRGREGGKVDVQGTPAQKTIDEAFGKEYVAWTQGGASDVTRNLAQLRSVQQDLLSPGDRNFTGPGVGLTPGKVRSVTNPAAQNALEKVEEVVQRNLRIILGAQFTEKEGERLIARAYNPMLEEDINAQRLALLIEMMDQAVQIKNSAAQYYEKSGSLRGWQGQIPTVQDFFDALDAVDEIIQQPQQFPGAPAVGTVEDGYEYIGGNPAEQSSWRPTQ